MRISPLDPISLNQSERIIPDLRSLIFPHMKSIIEPWYGGIQLEQKTLLGLD